MFSSNVGIEWTRAYPVPRMPCTPPLSSNEDNEPGGESGCPGVWCYISPDACGCPKKSVITHPQVWGCPDGARWVPLALLIPTSRKTVPLEMDSFWMEFSRDGRLCVPSQSPQHMAKRTPAGGTGPTLQYNGLCKRRKPRHG